MCVSPKRGGHFCSFWSSRLGKVMGPQSGTLPTTNRAARSIRKKRISKNNDGHPKSSHTVGGSFKRSNNNATTKTTTKHFTPLGERRGRIVVFASIRAPKLHQILAHRWGSVNNNATTNPIQVNNKCNNKTSHTVGGTSWLKCCFCLNLYSKLAPNPRTPWGEWQQQRNNNATTTQQQIQQQNP